MPKIISLQDWKNATNAIPFFRQSAQLKAVTDAFGQYAVNPMKLSFLRQMFNAWDTSIIQQVQGERTSLATARTDLRYTLDHAVTGQAVKATQVQPVGWALKQWTRAAYPWTAPVIPTQALPELSPAQIARVNESIRRAKNAAQVAHDAMVQVKHRGNLTPPLTPEQQVYKDYFKDPAYIQTVLGRFAILHLAFSNSPSVVDIRNTSYGQTCYAACFRKNLTDKEDGRGALLLTGRVEVFLGRTFFAGGDYEASTDATVGTLIHEFAHGSFSAVDAPKVDNAGNWELQPSTSSDNLWETPQNDQQSSTPELDKRLAKKEPRAAIVNADSYGQFAKELIILARK